MLSSDFLQVDSRHCNEKKQLCFERDCTAGDPHAEFLLELRESVGHDTAIGSVLCPPVVRRRYSFLIGTRRMTYVFAKWHCPVP